MKPSVITYKANAAGSTGNTPPSSNPLQPPNFTPQTEEGAARTSDDNNDGSEVNAGLSRAVCNKSKNSGRRTKSNQRWMKPKLIRMKPSVKREDSFLKNFSTRQIPETQETVEDTGSEDTTREHNMTNRQRGQKVQVSRTVVNPENNFYFYWLWLITVCILYNLWIFIALQTYSELQIMYHFFWVVCDGFVNGVFVLDVVVQFRTGYLERGLMVYDSKKLAKHYMASRSFLVDIAAVIPLNLLQHNIDINPIIRFIRLFKVYRAVSCYHMVESRTAYPNFWRAIYHTHILLLLAHWLACFYFLLSQAEGFQGNWTYPLRQEGYATLTRKYLASLYWSTSTLTTMGTTPTPETNAEYVFTIVSYLIRVLTFATIVGQVRNIIANKDANRLQFERDLDDAKNFMRYHKVTIFQECPPEFLHDFVLKMKPYIFTPGECICRKGEAAQEMFIVADGILEVISETGQVLSTMETGDVFGEIEILNLDGYNKRIADVRSVGYSELFSISRIDVLAALKHYPEAKEILQTLGRKRLQEAKNMARKCAKNSRKQQEYLGEMLLGIKQVIQGHQHEIYGQFQERFNNLEKEIRKRDKIISQQQTRGNKKALKRMNIETSGFENGFMRGASLNTVFSSSRREINKSGEAVSDQIRLDRNLDAKAGTYIREHAEKLKQRKSLDDQNYQESIESQDSTWPISQHMTSENRPSLSREQSGHCTSKQAFNLFDLDNTVTNVTKALSVDTGMHHIGRDERRSGNEWEMMMLVEEHEKREREMERDESRSHRYPYRFRDLEEASDTPQREDSPDDLSNSEDTNSTTQLSSQPVGKTNSTGRHRAGSTGEQMRPDSSEPQPGHYN